MPETATSSNRLRDLREAAGESRERLAADLGVVKETVTRWEKGYIPTRYLQLLATRYRVSISFLLRDANSEAA